MNQDNWQKVRQQIDSGHGNDKIDYPDPTAAPLGTDEEAGGATTPPFAIARETTQKTDHASSRQSTPGLGRRVGWVVIAAVIITALLVAISFWH